MIREIAQEKDAVLQAWAEERAKRKVNAFIGREGDRMLLQALFASASGEFVDLMIIGGISSSQHSQGAQRNHAGDSPCSGMSC
jgi:hypothetical protein